MLFKVYETPFFFGAVQYSSLRPQFVVFHLRFRRSSDACKVEGRPGGGRTNHEAMSKYTTGVGTFLCRFICLCFRCICFVYQVFILICFKDQPNNHAA